MKFKLFVYILLVFATLSCSTSSPLKQSAAYQASPINLSEEEQRTFDFYFYEGMRLKDEGLFQQALDSLHKSYALDSLDAGLLAEIAIMNAQIGHPERALSYMRSALDKDPDNWWYNIQLIHLYLNYNKIEKALAQAEKLQKKHPLKEEVYSLLIPLYQQSERFDDMLTMYDQLEKIIGINERIVFDKMGINLMLNRPKVAAAEIEKLINKYPYEFKYQVLKGDFLMQLQQPQKALEIYEQVLISDPRNPYAQISLSEYYNTKGDAGRSLEFVIKSLSNNLLELETKMEILGQHIENLIKSKTKLEDTEQLFQLLIEYYPLDERVHEYYAAYLRHLQRDSDALDVYESILAIKPGKETVWLSIMQVYFSQQDYEMAIETAHRALEVLNDKLKTYYFMAITYQVSGQYEKALETHLAALQLFNENEQPMLRSDFYTHLAETYSQLEQKELAYQAYEEAIRYNPDNVIALNNYAYNLALDKKELAKAERMSAKTIEKEPRNSTYLDTYAWVFYQQGKYSLAKFYIERAISYLSEDKDHGIYYEHYGDILWMTEKNDEKALENWQKAWDAGIQTEELKQKIENKGWNRE
jgi:tetratricopeptide (TPR) repeat protein